MAGDWRVLEPEQEELLAALVEADRKTPRDQRRPFMLQRFVAPLGDKISHPAFGPELYSAYLGDVQILARYGLILLNPHGRSSYAIELTPEGIRYYRALMQTVGEPLERI